VSKEKEDETGEVDPHIRASTGIGNFPEWCPPE